MWLKIKKILKLKKSLSFIDEDTITLSLSKLVEIEKKIMKEIKYQNELFQAQIDADIKTITWTLIILDKMQKDLALIKELRLDSNTKVGNNKLIMELEICKTKLDNLTKYRRSLQHQFPDYFPLKLKALNYSAVVGKLKKRIKEISRILEKNNSNTKITFKLNYKNYKFNLQSIT